MVQNEEKEPDAIGRKRYTARLFKLQQKTGWILSGILRIAVALVDGAKDQRIRTGLEQNSQH